MESWYRGENNRRHSRHVQSMKTDSGLNGVCFFVMRFSRKELDELERSLVCCCTLDEFGRSLMCRKAA